MGHYIISFSVYTLAMCGLIFFALFVYKKVMSGNISNNKTKQLSIEESMSINPRKTLMIVKAGNERFLIASDIDKTTLIAKLDNQTLTDLQLSSPSSPSVVSVEKTEKKNYEVPDLEQVKNKIESENINILYPQKNDKLANNKFAQDFQSAEVNKPVQDKKVHLEVISNNNPKAAKLNRHHSYMSKKTELTVGEIKNHGFSTMKEMAQKINEM